MQARMYVFTIKRIYAAIHTHTHTHIHTQGLSAACNEMSNQLCQIACLPEGEKRRGVCANAAHILFLFFFLLFSFCISCYFGQKERRRVEHCSPLRAREQRGASARISRLLSTLASFSLRLHLRERSIWPIASPPASRRDRWGEGWSGSVRIWRTVYFIKLHPNLYGFNVTCMIKVEPSKQKISTRWYFR